MDLKNKIKVCLSTDDFINFSDNKSTVVIVDLLRASSVISTAFQYCIRSIIPVKNLEETLLYKD